MKFGTSGLRGLVEDLEGRATSLYVQAFAQHLLQAGLAKPGQSVLVGRDFRSSSPGIAATAIGALQRAGFLPVDCGAIPTPALALYGLKLRAPSLMITGSHIPDDRNGIKFYRPDGEIDKQDEARIAALAAELGGQDIDFTPGAAPDRSADALALFASRNETLLPAGALSGLRIGVYQHSTVARDLLVQVLRHYGAEVVPLGRSDHFIPLDTEAVSAQTVSVLKAWSQEHRLDAIVSADGDGDRPLVADETGEPLRGDLLGLAAAMFLKAAVLVTPVTSNSGIEKAGNVKVMRTKVGSPYVIAGMIDAVARGHGRIIGFEANGGTLTPSPFEIEGRIFEPLPTRDSFLPILAVLSLAAEAKHPLSAIAAGFRLPFTAADRLTNFPTETSDELMAYLRSDDRKLAAFLAPIGRVAGKSDIDGLRVGLDDGRVVHFRQSGNAPEMRCYVEAADEAGALELLEKGLDLIRQWATKGS